MAALRDATRHRVSSGTIYSSGSGAVQARIDTWVDTSRTSCVGQSGQGTGCPARLSGRIQPAWAVQGEVISWVKKEGKIAVGHETRFLIRLAARAAAPRGPRHRSRAPPPSSGALARAPVRVGGGSIGHKTRCPGTAESRTHLARRTHNHTHTYATPAHARARTHTLSLAPCSSGARRLTLTPAPHSSRIWEIRASAPAAAPRPPPLPAS